MKRREPLYISILEIIKERIMDGHYPLGSLLPTEPEFESEFKVSKITVRKAIELLESDGYVLKQSGKGTTVISNSIFNKLSKGDSFSNILKKEGIHLHKAKTTIETITITADNELSNFFKQKCLRITRLYYLEDKPYIYFTHYLPANLKLEKLIDDNTFSIYMQLYKNKQYIAHFHDEFYIDYPNDEILKELNTSKQPMLSRKRVTYNTLDEVIEISYALYRSELHPYVIDYNV